MGSARYDVVVCGGGPAGIGAATASGQAGARVLLVEMSARLGGAIGNVGLGNFCDSPGGPAFDALAEGLLDLDAARWRRDDRAFRPPGRLNYDSESACALATEMVADAGVDVLLCTFAESALVRDACVTGVVLAAKSGPMRVSAKVTIDATADGDIAASAGAEFLQGDPEDGRIQLCNFRWQIGGVNVERFAQERPSDAELAGLFRQANRSGAIRAPDSLFGQDATVFPFAPSEGRLRMVYWELCGIDPTDPVQTSRALVECQRAALRIVRFCREHLPGYEDCRIERLPAALGTRESRRIVGQYTLTGEDVRAGRKFPDGVVPAWFWTDLHDPPPGLTIPYGLDYIEANRPPPGDWYEIPYRCLLPRDVDGLLMAGRCISCDRMALGSLRVMPTCMYLGTVAGTAAARAVEAKVLPSAVDGASLKRDLPMAPIAGGGNRPRS